MPVIHVYASTPISESQRDTLKATYGKAIELVPGKTEKWLMCLFEENVPIYHGGTNDKPAALVTLDIYATEEVDAGVWSELTKVFCASLNEVLGIDPSRVYVRYGTTPNFGWNNMNF